LKQILLFLSLKIMYENLDPKISAINLNLLRKFSYHEVEPQVGKRWRAEALLEDRRREDSSWGSSDVPS